MTAKTHTQGLLTLEVEHTTDQVMVRWRGKSTSREPSEFILPILTRALDDCVQESKRLVIDFRGVEYLNSSSITPIIRVLELVKRGRGSASVVYSRDLKWQALSFTALKVFHTSDQRIDIQGL